MIAGKDCAKTSDAATGCTFASTSYDVDLPDGLALKIWDTAGLREAASGEVDFKKAVSNIYELTRVLDGVHLLVYCIRGEITDRTVQNYEMFNTFCDGKVPIAIVITGLENRGNIDTWWGENTAAFNRAGMEILDHVCVATLRLQGRDEDYAAWTATVRGMISKRCLLTPWVVEKDRWFVSAVAKLTEVSFDGLSNGSKKLYQGLINNGFSKEEAQRAAREYDVSSKQIKVSPLVCMDEPKLTMSLSRKSRASHNASDSTAASPFDVPEAFTR